MNIKIYHNPRCSKSREVLALLQAKGIKPEVMEYLVHPPTKKELADIVAKLNVPVTEIIRKNESVWKEYYAGKELTDDRLLEVIAKNPLLLQRPIVVSGDRAVIGRPPENVLELL